MPKTYSSIWIHTIWTTKNRIPLLNKDFRIDLCTFIRKNAQEKQIHLDMINGIEDHLHALISLLPTQSIAEAMQQIKGASSYWINKNELVNVKFRWQQGYGALSVSPHEIDKIRKYIKKQQQHHKHWNLEEELERFKHFNQESQ
jgi:REP element-mobilizing transposase RayT